MSNTIKYKVSKIKAKTITHPRTDPDEIYLAAFATTAKSSVEDGKKVFVKKFVDKKLSQIKTKIWPDTSFVPEGISGSIPFSDDAEFVYLTLALYEADDKVLYEKIKTKVEEPPEPEDIEWGSIEIPGDPTSPLEWLKAIWKVVSMLYNHFKQDDNFYFYNEGIRIADIPVGSKWAKKVVFQRYGGDYVLDLELERPK